MKILFIGDIYGSLGRQMIQEQLPKIKETYKPHFIIANGENISHGKGINEKQIEKRINRTHKNNK